MTHPCRRAVFAALAVLFTALAATAAHAVILADLTVNAAARPYGPGNPVESRKQEFSVPGGPGTLIMTYTEEAYVGGPGGFTIDPKDLSSARLGFGGSTEYTPRNPSPGQFYRVRTTWLYAFSQKIWVATLTARHTYQAFQVRDRGLQRASKLRLVVEFIPGPRGGEATPGDTSGGSGRLVGSWNWGAGGGVVEILSDGTGRDSRGNTMRWTVKDAAAGLYELRWSHGFTDTATLSTDGGSVAIVNNVGTRFTATRRGAAPQTAPTPASPQTGNPLPATPAAARLLPPGADRYDSTPELRGDPFNGGHWANSRGGSAFASRTFERPVCVTGFTLQSAGSDVTTAGARIEITLVSGASRQRVLDVRGAAINRGFSPGGPGGEVLPPQAVSFSAPIEAKAIEVSMQGNGWFLMEGLRFVVVDCP